MKEYFPTIPLKEALEITLLWHDIASLTDEQFMAHLLYPISAKRMVFLRSDRGRVCFTWFWARPSMTKNLISDVPERHLWFRRREAGDIVWCQEVVTDGVGAFEYARSIRAWMTRRLSLDPGTRIAWWRGYRGDRRRVGWLKTLPNCGASDNGLY